MGTTATTFAPVLLPISLIFSPGAMVSASTANPRYVSEISSHPVHAISEARSSAESTVAASGKISKGFQLLTDLPEWLAPTVKRLEGYYGKQDGWKGEGSLAPDRDAISSAIALLSQFATEMPNLSAPLVSADDDGSICLYWRADPMMATVSVYSDGTFAYYAEGYDDPVRSDESVVGELFEAGLISVMTGTVVSVPLAG